MRCHELSAHLRRRSTGQAAAKKESVEGFENYRTLMKIKKINVRDLFWAFGYPRTWHHYALLSKQQINMTPIFQQLILRSELTEEEIVGLSEDDFQELIRLPHLKLDVIARVKLLREWKNLPRPTPQVSMSSTVSSLVDEENRMTASAPIMPTTMTSSLVAPTHDSQNHQGGTLLIELFESDDESREDQKPATAERQPERVTSSQGSSKSEDANEEDRKLAAIEHTPEQVSSTNELLESDVKNEGNRKPAAVGHPAEAAARGHQSSGGGVTSWWTGNQHITQDPSASSRGEGGLASVTSVPPEPNRGHRARNESISRSKYGDSISRAMRLENRNKRDRGSSDQGTEPSNLPRDGNHAVAGANQGAQPTPEPTEPDPAFDEPPLKRPKARVDIEVSRKYEDRFLLQRHHLHGIGRLGGSPQDTFPKPKEGHKRLQDLEHLGDFKVAAFNDL